MSVNGNIKAIETHYKGYRFRSRLEARWAVFFDRLDLRWTYEPEGYEMASGARYLPDFLVRTPAGGPIYYEVKPDNFTTCPRFEEFARAIMGSPLDGVVLVDGFTPRVVMLRGDPLTCLRPALLSPPLRVPVIQMCPRCGEIHRGLAIDVPCYMAVWCNSCDQETPEGGDQPYESGVCGYQVMPYKGAVEIDPFEYQCFVRTVVSAGAAARQERFGT